MRFEHESIMYEVLVGGKQVYVSIAYLSSLNNIQLFSLSTIGATMIVDKTGTIDETIKELKKSEEFLQFAETKNRVVSSELTSFLLKVGNVVGLERILDITQQLIINETHKA